MDAAPRCPNRKLVQAFRHGKVSGERLRQLKAHLKECGPCRALLRALSAESGKTASLAPTPRAASGFTTRIPMAGQESVACASAHSFLLPPVEAGEIGRLGNYRVLSQLGAGGMGFVFHAEDLTLCRPVALKVMKPELARAAGGGERFLREARAMASIRHESLVTVFQVGQEGDVVYLAMELLHGSSLEDWLGRVGRPELPEVLRLARQTLAGLAVIHRHGLIHRDLKPANLWVEEPGGRVKILDFGLARFVEEDVALTQTGTILGTPTYMSPEQARGEPLDARSDLFSFGCVLYTLCTGTSPFQARTTTAVLTALAVHDPSPAHQLNPAVPRSLSDLIAQLLAKAPADRPASAEEVLERLRKKPPSRTGVRPKPPARPTLAVTDGAAARPTRSRKRRPSGRRWLKVSLAGLTVAAVVTVPWLASALLRPSVNGAPPPKESPASAPLSLQPAAVAVTQPVVYLSELAPTARQNWPILPPPPPWEKGPGPMDEKEWPGPGPGVPGPGWPSKGPEVRIQGKESPHGIFMHAAPPWDGPASLSYRLGRQFKTFRAQVSMNDGPGPSANPVTFAVYGDGKALWKSRPVSRQADTQACTVDVQGVETLKIEVQCPGEPRAAHAVWIEPSLVR